MGRAGTIALLSAIALLSVASADAKAPARRGAFAFHYSPVLTEEALGWYSKFDILVTHDPLPREQVARLRAAGTKLLVYEWSVAFYDTRATKWQRSLLSGGKELLLNQRPLTGGAGSKTAPAWYFDPATAEHETGRAAALASFLESIGYDGVFLDTTRFENVHPQAREEYARRHPETPYDLAFSRFLARLRKELPQGVIFTNQGYRAAEYYLPYVDWDLTESLITRPRGSSYELRPWHDAVDPWNSIHFLMRRVIEPLKEQYPSVRFGHLNYIDRDSRHLIPVIVATAQLFGTEAFVAAPSIVGELDAIYFRDPGKPVSRRFDRHDERASYRFFENGLIAVSSAAAPLIIGELPRTGLRNHITGELMCGDRLSLSATGDRPEGWFFNYTDDCDQISSKAPAGTGSTISAAEGMGKGMRR